MPWHTRANMGIWSVSTTALNLKQRHRGILDGQPEPPRSRIPRALGCLVRSEQEVVDQNACFISEWITFNPGYARKLAGRGPSGIARARLAWFPGGAGRTEATVPPLFQQFSRPLRTP